MSKVITSSHQSDWSGFEKAIFRIAFIYFILQAVPFDWKYYRNLFSINWLHLQFSDIFYISRYTPQIIGSHAASGWGLNTYIDWVVLLVLAGIGAVIWSFREQKTLDYDKLYYWLRVIVRYRLAIGIIAYGFIKFFPLQAPFPSISNLNTPYGYFTRWKIFSLSLGIVPTYESFLGLVEIVGGLLLLFRKTATIGALIIVVFLGNVFFSNLAYDGGEAIYALYLISLGLLLLSFDIIRLVNLIGFERPTQPNHFQPSLPKKWQPARLVLKSVFILFFVVIYGFKTYSAYHNDVYQFPKAAGLKDAAGFYNVSSFKLNKDTLAYSATDTSRWTNLVFEKWATISIAVNKPVKLDSALTEEVNYKDPERNYELAGSTGRQYYSYVVDSVNQVLKLQNKNSNYKNDQIILHYTQPDSTRFVLSGVEGKDSVYAVLDKIDKKYLLQEVAKKGRDKSIKL
ncbi:DoxX family protein [Mucilaginibacter sp. dw_454]|uniref:DoxX family protein n=1 Tax=Mucilaginibacter sp. dw_454 TaxID=2720079 RepID=UPI001BD3B4C3|nr:DoxX family protein [Mucilaginibacter sp. dw_454]